MPGGPIDRNKFVESDPEYAARLWAGAPEEAKRKATEMFPDPSHLQAYIDSLPLTEEEDDEGESA